MRRNLLRGIPLSDASVDLIASGLLARATDGVPLTEPSSAPARYLSVSAAQVQEAFTRWLSVRPICGARDRSAKRVLLDVSAGCADMRAFDHVT